jgi:hypothetical protein
MKNLYPFSFIFICALNINAQITLTSSSSIPDIGESYDYYYISDYTFDVSQSGANQTWNFSTASSDLTTIDIIDLASSLEPSTFPQANLVMGAETLDNPEGVYGENYLSNSSSDWSIEGSYITDIVRYIYTDKREILKFPITYNDIFNETFVGTIENIQAGQTFDITAGTSEITADGYGDLILPYTTVNNVLKIKITSNYTIVYMGIPIYNITEILNFWYNAATHLHIAETVETYTDGSPSGSYAYYIAPSDLVLGVDNSQLKDSQITVYPNPASNYFNIKNTSGEVLNANIFDTSGRSVKSLSIGLGEKQIDAANLHSGVYIIKFNKGSQYFTKKLIVK